jgi:hypothetical protein
MESLAFEHQCPLWVKSGKARTEQMLSAFTPLATAARTSWIVSFVPIADMGSQREVSSGVGLNPAINS